jgi:hypothetical protein
MGRTITIAVFLLFSAWATCTAQYYGERVLEKSFEQTDFFFTPTPLLPYGIGGFRSVAASVFNDPLSRIALNPAYCAVDTPSEQYAYLDFRSISEIRSQSNQYYGPMYDYVAAKSVAYYPYPRYYLDTRKELQPVFSGAFIGRPLPSLLPQFHAGITYQAIFQDEAYYEIPQDIYHTVLGYDYSGAKSAAENLPIVDRYKGNDDIHHLAHMLAFVASYDIASRLRAGVKLGWTRFNRDGSFGSQNLWDGVYNPGYRSIWGNLESREQQYHDLDLSAGISYRFGQRDELGIVAGHLWGNADQLLVRTDTSFYGNGNPGVGPNWSYFMQSGLTNETWRHNGGTSYGGIQLTRALSNTLTMHLQYGFNKQSVDIGLGAAVTDTSYSTYRYQQSDTLASRSDGFSMLSDVRSGGGTKTSSAHRLFGSFQWQPMQRASVTIGVQLDFQTGETNTDEGVISRRQSSYTSSYGTGYNYNSYDRTIERKHLLWTFTTDVTTIQIPIVFQWQATDWLDALVGVTRTMSSWEVNDVTLALFSLRDRQTSNGNERTTDFGERYTMPRERVSDVRTTALVGLTARAASFLNVRLLVTPNVVDNYDGSHIQDLRWWLSFQLNP